MKPAVSFLMSTCVILAAVTASADNWPNWRGPTQTGVAAAGRYPTTWSADENIAWKFELPSHAGATPAVWGEHIFVTASRAGKNVVIDLNRDGEKQWETAIGDERPGKHKKASGSNSSPVTDGEYLFAYYKSGDLACLDFEGRVLWSKNLQERFGEDTLWWDLGTSPVLTTDHVVVAVIQSDSSYIVACDKKSGEVAWKVDRNLDAPEEANQTYSTPVVVNDGDRQILVMLGADHVTAHNAADGEEIWRVGGLNPTGHKYFRSIASPVVAAGIVAAPYARGGSLTAIRLGGKGDITDSHVAWVGEEFSADVPTPAADNGRLYISTDKGKVACQDIKTGKLIWSGELPKNRASYSASPIVADGKLYLTREDGTTFVVATEKFEVLAENALDDFAIATPVFVDGRILLRTSGWLWCVGEK